ncbi:hypothetical protein AB0C52_16590 [Streptomyces sp. NPDC048717]|uniref:hypothetical protein n=1 Tax=Streptomyces sp. NPDC048717 TaxID=3154928 RepID=UPI0034274FE6
MMQLKRSAVAMLSAAALGLAATAATAAPAQAAQDSGASTQAVYWLNFKYSSWSHWTPDSKTSSHAGTLNAGWNYVYCWKSGENYTDKGHTSTVWLQTDDDSGNPRVYVSRVYLDDSSYNADLPHC